MFSHVQFEWQEQDFAPAEKELGLQSTKLLGMNNFDEFIEQRCERE